MKTSEKIIEAKNNFIRYNEIGMCSSFDELPILFNYYIALLFFGARYGCKDWFWWDENDRLSRLNYFDWLIKVYKFFGK